MIATTVTMNLINCGLGPLNILTNMEGLASLYPTTKRIAAKLDKRNHIEQVGQKKYTNGD